MKLAVVGAGWAGLACAIEATRAGHAVTLFEATRTLGGRARALAVTLPGGERATLDNGQHILIGAYSVTLALMRSLGLEPEALLHRMPLTLRFADGGGLQVPRWPSPLDLLGGIAGARGWSWSDKAALVATTLRWRLGGFRCAADATVASLCASLPPRVVQELIDPLCISALNTPIATANGAVFLRVLRDALFAERGGADLLLPLVDLGALLPVPAQRWLLDHGAELRLGHRVQDLATTTQGWQIDGETFDRVVLACPAWEAARLAADAGRPDAMAWARSAQALRHDGIATVYATSASSLPQPLLALRSGPESPAQFVFDRGQLGGPRGLLAFVVSATADDRDRLQQRVMAQGRAQLGLSDLQHVQTVVERRATFSCTPRLVRPSAQVAPGLLACGDYVEGPYPATIEGAVRSALAAATAAGRPATGC